MSLPKLIKEVEKLTFATKPTVLSKLISAAGLLANIPEAKHLLEEAAPEPKPAPAPAPSPKPKFKPKKDVSSMPVGG